MRTLGLEIGAREVRGVLGEQRRGRWALLEAQVAPLPAEPVERAAALSAFVDEHGRGARLVAGLPLADASLRLVNFPATSEDNLARLATVEAESHFGVSGDGFVCGQATVEPNAAGQATVAVAVARRERLAALLGALTPPVVSLDAVALANLFGPAVKARGVATAIVHGGQPGALLVLLDPSGRLRQARVLPSASTLATEVQRSLRASAGGGAEPVALVLLSGRVEGWRETLAEALDLPVELGDPWQTLGLAGVGGAAQATAYAVATGLMLQGGEVALPLNLCAAPRPVAEVRRRQTSTVGLALAAFMCGALALGGWFYSDFRAQQRLLAGEQAKVERLKQELAKSTGEPPDFLAKLRGEADQVRAQDDWLDLLRQLSERLPANVALAEWSADRERGLTMRGEARRGELVSEVLASLTDLKRFAGARLDQYDARKVGDQTLYAFQITCNWLEKGGKRRD